MKEIKGIGLSFLIILLPVVLLAQPKNDAFLVFQTTKGTLKVRLYEETSMHRDNFTKLLSEGYFNGMLFHRVIKDFMIQTGDPLSKNAKPGVALGTGGPGYTIPAEIFPQFYHKKGALAAARTGDNVNPARESSGSQFYIIQGQKFTAEQLKSMENSNTHIRFTPEQIKAYTTLGGAPHLDYAYTVFGEVVDGLDIVDKIAAVETDGRDRPVENITIIKAYLLK